MTLIYQNEYIGRHENLLYIHTSLDQCFSLNFIACCRRLVKTGRWKKRSRSVVMPLLSQTSDSRPSQNLFEKCLSFRIRETQGI